jgi:hypothetical protein
MVESSDRQFQIKSTDNFYYYPYLGSKVRLVVALGHRQSIEKTDLIAKPVEQTRGISGE